jgi:hypothetical protein
MGVQFRTPGSVGETPTDATGTVALPDKSPRIRGQRLMRPLSREIDQALRK